MSTFTENLVNISPRDYLVWYLYNREKITQINSDDLFEETIRQYFIDKGAKYINISEFAESTGILYLQVGVQIAYITMPEWIIIFWDILGYDNSKLLDDTKVILGLLNLIEEEIIAQQIKGVYQNVS